MDILERYAEALALYKAKNFDAALEGVNDVKSATPYWKKPFLLEAYIWREQTEYVKEIRVLEELLPQFNFDSPDEKYLAADALSVYGSVIREVGRISEAVESFRLSAALEGGGEKSCVEISNALFAANNAANFSADDFRALYNDYKKYLADVKPYSKKFYNHSKIRVGFMSADFHWHVAMAWSWDLLTGLDKNFFAVYCYSSSADSDVVTENLRKVIDGWRDISSLTDAQAAEVIRGDEIDILFDLSGHTSGNRLRVAAYRPASVQVSGLGYMNSTGLDAIDYFLSDVHCAGNASAMREYFAEKIIMLPQSHFCYNTSVKLEPFELSCRKKGFVTFGSFNQFSKVTDLILRAWKKILDAVPNSRLLLKHKVFNTEDCRNFVGERLKNFGIDTARVDMRGYTANHLLDYADVDIALDTFPYTGGVTTCEALYMGIPVVSLYGGRHGSRFGLSILKNVGLDELAVDSVDDYVRRAVMLASDWELLNDLRKNLRGMMERSPLMNSTNYVRTVEKVFSIILDSERR